MDPPNPPVVLRTGGPRPHRVPPGGGAAADGLTRLRLRVFAASTGLHNASGYDGDRALPSRAEVPVSNRFPCPPHPFPLQPILARDAPCCAEG